MLRPWIGREFPRNQTRLRREQPRPVFQARVSGMSDLAHLRPACIRPGRGQKASGHKQGISAARKTWKSHAAPRPVSRSLTKS